MSRRPLARRTGYAAPHTVHCGPDGIFLSALGAPDGNGPGGTFILDPETFDVRGRWELDRGPQQLMYDIWWHLGLDTMVTSTWGTPNMVKDGINPELLLGGKYGSKLHVWDLRRRRHVQEIDLGAEQQMVLELRPAHDPTRAYGFASVVMSLKDLSSSIWLWYRDPKKGSNGSDGPWAVKKVIEIPAEPADPEKLPPLLQGFKAVAPLVTDINLSVDDRYLYVSCWGTGEFIQYDVTDPFNPKKVSSLRLGGIVSRAAHPSKPEQPLNGGPQMVEVSRDGRRIFFTNSLYTPWDRQTLPGRHPGVDRQGRCAIWRRGDDAGQEFLRRHRRHAATPGSVGRRRRVLRFVLLRVSGEARGTWTGRRWFFWVPTTASIPAWDGCLPWRWVCSTAARAVCGVRCRRSRSVTPRPSAWSC